MGDQRLAGKCRSIGVSTFAESTFFVKVPFRQNQFFFALIGDAIRGNRERGHLHLDWPLDTRRGQLNSSHRGHRGQCCSGTFFDPGKEASLFGPLLSSDIWQDSTICTSKRISKLLSPVSGRPMRADRVFFRKPVEIDRCEQSGELWLDKGEADRLRELVETASQADASPLKEQRPKRGLFSYLVQLGTGLPLEVRNPRRRFSWATISLVLACVIVFAFELCRCSGVPGTPEHGDLRIQPLAEDRACIPHDGPSARPRSHSSEQPSNPNFNCGGGARGGEGWITALGNSR